MFASGLSNSLPPKEKYSQIIEERIRNINQANKNVAHFNQRPPNNVADKLPASFAINLGPFSQRDHSPENEAGHANDNIYIKDKYNSYILKAAKGSPSSTVAGNLSTKGQKSSSAGRYTNRMNVSSQDFREEQFIDTLHEGRLSANNLANEKHEEDPNETRNDAAKNHANKLMNYQKELELLEDKDNHGYMTYNSFGVLLNKLNIFRYLYSPGGQYINMGDGKSSGKLSFYKTKLDAERAFLLNLWSILTLFNGTISEAERDYVPIRLVSDFLLVLMEENLTVHAAANGLQEIMANDLKERQELLTEDPKKILVKKEVDISDYILHFNIIREEQGYWSTEKIVIEFRKLFEENNTRAKDKTNPNVFLEKVKTIMNRLEQEEGKSHQDKGRKSPESSKSPVHTNLNRHDLLFEHSKYLKGKKELFNDMKSVDEMQACTFKPQIKQIPRHGRSASGIQIPTTISASARMKKVVKDEHELLLSEINDKYWDKTYSGQCYDRLYENAKKKGERQELYRTLKYSKEIKQIEEECSFRPNISVPPQQPPPRSPIKGFKEIITRLERAREEKKRKEELLNNPLLKMIKNAPEDFRSKTLGRTIARPFSFDKREKSAGNAHAQRDSDLLCYLDVSIAPGKTGRIAIHKGDDPKSLARSFTKIYSLNEEKNLKLETLITECIDGFFRISNLN